MQYVSTRGETSPMGFMDAVLSGLAPDGGLLIPESIPDLSAELERLTGLSYAELSFEIFQHFCDVPADDLRTIVERACSAFAHPEVAPLIPIDDNLYLLELFHGPTLAFKDMAMQFLANCFEYILQRRDTHLNILGSTSGDTGSAAIHGVRGKPRLRIFMMHPKGRTSPLQERQMTSVRDDNVHNLAVDGTFDDCQRMMKEVFRDRAFKEKLKLGAVNSVNWARVLAQIVYYFYAGLKIREKLCTTTVRFAVPTGNFGNILAGFYATRMGLPVERLILATNENDILARYFQSGDYSRGNVAQTLSPSMDIQAASNFERYLYYRLQEHSESVAGMMRRFEQEGVFEMSETGPLDPALDKLFLADRCDRDATLDEIRRTFEARNLLLDPHSAVGVAVGRQFQQPGQPMVCLATAHPAKFPAAIEAACGQRVTHPTLEVLKDVETRCTDLPAEVEALKEYLLQKCID